MEYNKEFFEKVFSTKRMERYFSLYPGNESRAMLHYRYNLQLAEGFLCQPVRAGSNLAQRLVP